MWLPKQSQNSTEPHGSWIPWCLSTVKKVSVRLPTRGLLGLAATSWQLPFLVWGMLFNLWAWPKRSFDGTSFDGKNMCFINHSTNNFLEKQTVEENKTKVVDDDSTSSGGSSSNRNRNRNNHKLGKDQTQMIYLDFLKLWGIQPFHFTWEQKQQPCPPKKSGWEPSPWLFSVVVFADGLVLLMVPGILYICFTQKAVVADSSNAPSCGVSGLECCDAIAIDETSDFGN